MITKPMHKCEKYMNKKSTWTRKAYILYTWKSCLKSSDPATWNPYVSCRGIYGDSEEEFLERNNGDGNLIEAF